METIKLSTLDIKELCHKIAFASHEATVIKTINNSNSQKVYRENIIQLTKSLYDEFKVFKDNEYLIVDYDYAVTWLLSLFSTKRIGVSYLNYETRGISDLDCEKTALIFYNIFNELLTGFDSIK